MKIWFSRVTPAGLCLELSADSRLSMNKLTRISALAIVALGALGFAGCRSVPLDPAGELVAVYQFGEFRMVLNTTAPKTFKAAQDALPKFELFSTKTSSDKYAGRIVARAPGDQKVTIIIQEINSVQTLLRIRWGEGGNLTKSRRFYEAIEAGVK